MYRKKIRSTTSLTVNESVEGESIETRIERLMANGDENPETKELIFTRKEDGVIGGFDIRHDYWDEAYEKASEMAIKDNEMDAQRLERRKQTIQEQKEINKKIREQAKNALNEGKNQGQEGQDGV
ncbi:hypothetical protein HDC92_004768 [Pedobacter sp. AK017]|uniref:hypothetical protein n=1 Tax=Pedobacter sp. AK017 TaxID=2723073 RepID=UPI001613E4D8|nr:hypothetical protein [Pedobacter sp. AK017]MBB5441064.1 hypothetical protein [Pedobacter sp. AK017]